MEGVKTNDEALQKANNKIDRIDNRVKSSEDTVSSLEQRLNQMSDELKAFNDRFQAQQMIIERLERANNDQLLERKKMNIIIEGLPKDAAISLLNGIGVNFQTKIVTAYRLGGVNKQTTRPKPRPILVKLTSPTDKYEIYKNVKKLKEKEETKRVYIKDDLPVDIARQRQDMRCLAALA